MSKSSFWKKEFLGVARSVHATLWVIGILTSLVVTYVANGGISVMDFVISWSAYFVGFYVVLGTLYKFDVGNKKSSE